MSEPRRYFGLDEANAAVQIIRPLLREALEIRQTILKRQPEVWPVVEKAAGNVLATGAILKDINIGLVDFLAQRNGREVYLCWKFGEEQIDFWHDIDAGFSGRRPVDEF
jgi:hypothetical protein